ncbi:MOSC domain-containing protein [Arcobacter sp. FWKO B]|uniref:MOSC domain-containing protein n=1 Tax=Arcobacter sp. FWKO B TaxID=2593672 RepID=UPI0018A48D64|nr:MOSC domain-containing protein [Arcobacter sp. FWKO B]QOG11916.1 MOSC domain-containing protein [Arcobacter sp. FWKO B]
MDAKVVSLQVGKVKNYGSKESKDFISKYWESGSFKEPTQDDIWASKLGLLGDEVADKIHHGGVDKAIFANSYENYPTWAKFLGEESLPFGALAENLTISYLHESSVCIGDIHKIGSAILQVSQPRKPCWKISRKWKNQDFTNEIYISGLTGWYYRVLEEGAISANNEVCVLEQDPQRISILTSNIAYTNPIKYQEILENILKIKSLALSYEASIHKRLNGSANLDYMKL